MNKKEILQKRAACVDEVEKLLTEAEKSGEFPDEVQGKVKELQAEVEKYDQLLAARGNLEESQKNFTGVAIIPEMHKEGAKNNGGFKNFGEFVSATRFGDKKGRLDAISKDQSMGEQGAGGYLVPDQFSTELLRLTESAAIVRGRATVIPAGSPPDATLHIPVLDYSENMFGGVEVAWINEGDEKPSTQASFETISLTPQELAGTITTTDKLLRNFTASGVLFENLLSSALAQATDMSFLRGDGTGKPLGVLSAGNAGALEVMRDTSGTITYEDVLSMLVSTKMDGEAYTWVAHQSTIPALAKLQDAAGNYIFIQGNATTGIPAMLAGHPVIFTARTFPLGTRGDLALIDFSKYLIKDGSGVSISASPHPLFKENKTIIKAFLNVDGKPWVTSPITLEDGTTQVSPYVVLGV